MRMLYISLVRPDLDYVKPTYVTSYLLENMQKYKGGPLNLFYCPSITIKDYLHCILNLPTLATISSF